MDEYTLFLIDACTIAALIVLSLYHLRMPKRDAPRPRTTISLYLSFYPLGLAIYIFFRSAVAVLCRGNVLPSVYLEFFWYDNLMLPGVVAGAAIMLFSSFKIMAVLLQFTRRQKYIGWLAAGLAPLLLFAWSLRALWIGQAWYNENYIPINLCYLSSIAILCGLAVYALAKNKRPRIIQLFLVVGTLLGILMYLSLAQTINFSFDAIPLTLASLWLTFLLSHQSLQINSMLVPKEVPDQLGATPITAVDKRLDKLSLSQKQVATLLLKGLGYKEIAGQMGLSLSAVKRRVHGIYQKFGVENRTEFFLACKVFSSGSAFVQ